MDWSRYWGKFQNVTRYILCRSNNSVIMPILGLDKLSKLYSMYDPIHPNSGPFKIRKLLKYESGLLGPNCTNSDHIGLLNSRLFEIPDYLPVLCVFGFQNLHFIIYKICQNTRFILWTIFRITDVRFYTLQNNDNFITFFLLCLLQFSSGLHKKLSTNKQW